MGRYEVYLNCSATGELEFPYETEAASAREAGEEMAELADSECLAGGVHTIREVKCCGIEESSNVARRYASTD